MDSEIERVLREWALSKSFIIRLWVFGSRPRGDHREDSDLDVTVQIGRIGQFYGPAEVFHCHRDEWEAELQPLLPHKLHLLPFGHTDATRTVESHWQLVFVQPGHAQAAIPSQESFDAAERTSTSASQTPE